MQMLDRKLLRDFRRMWAQILAISLVMSSGVATLILATSAYRSLEESRAAYYERNGFADAFASLTRAPLGLIKQIEAVAGVSVAEPRLVKNALLDIPGLVEPATGLVISLPEVGAQRLNRVHLREGRLPESGRSDEVTVNEAFANAHQMSIGSVFKAILNGRIQQLHIVGTALSPEFIYAIGPGDLMPDDRRFGVLWMSQRAVAALFDLEGAFNSLTMSFVPGADQVETLAHVDKLLERYGGTAAYGRADQVSHAFIDAELKQLAALARVMPPIFLLVAAFLINIAMSRLIALERETIGLLKALGYGPTAIASHYIKFVLLIASVGIVLGFVGGTLLGEGLTRLYTDFFRFPLLVFRNDPDVYVVAGAISGLAAVAGAVKAVRDAVRLPPAVAMQPPAPPRYRRLIPSRPAQERALSMTALMAFRNIVRRPVRASLTMLGLALAVALLVTALMSFDSVERMIEIAFNSTDRQHATLTFSDVRDASVVAAVARLPGVMRTEPQRSVAVRLRAGPRTRKLSITGKPEGMDLSRVLDLDLAPLALPSTGLVISARVSEILGVGRGDIVEVDILEGK